MNKALLLLLKSLGIEITPEQISMVEALIPKIPKLLNDAVNTVNSAIRNFDERLKAIEQRQKSIEEQLDGLRRIAESERIRRTEGNGTVV